MRVCKECPHVVSRVCACYEDHVSCAVYNYTACDGGKNLCGFRISVCQLVPALQINLERLRLSSLVEIEKNARNVDEMQVQNIIRRCMSCVPSAGGGMTYTMTLCNLRFYRLRRSSTFVLDAGYV